MKRFAIGLIASLAFLTIGVAAQKAETFSGEVMDSPCAMLGGHEKMIAKGENAKDCTIRCVGMGGKYVLYDGAKKLTYQLDDQKKAEKFAGAKVKVTGSFDEATKTIHVADIKAGS
jgi:type 1 fimbria pilin